MRTIRISSASGFPTSITKFGLCVFLLAFTAPVPGEPGKPTAKALFIDVSETNLPRADLLGFSMDAESADLDGDKDLDLVTANFDDIRGRRFDAPGLT